MGSSVFGAAFEVGTILLGKYRVEGLLGRGGMGVVIAARHVELGALFAIKLLDPDTLANANAAKRFLGEAQAAALLDSEHVARVHDVGHLDDGTPYLVMEHLSGENLAQVLARRGPLPLDEVVQLILQACDALSEAHAQGIVHRDIKLANLFLVQRRGRRPCLKVIDFGISKRSGEHLTMPGALVGSVHSMAPEQILGTQSADARADIWALGVALHQLTIGVSPFEGESVSEVLQRVLHATPEPPSRRRPELPAALDAVVARCLSKDPEDRHRDVAALAAALRALPAQGHRVFISCRYEDEGDREIASAFHEALSAAGARPFLAPLSVRREDRWTGEVAEALRGCEALLLLLSPRAAVSEVVAAEVDLARQLAGSHGGRPFIVPVRVRFPEGAAGAHPLEDRLHDVDHAVWEGPEDTAAVVKRVLDRIGCDPARAVAVAEALSASTRSESVDRPVAAAPAERPGGVVSARSPFYVARPGLEDACRREVSRPGALLRIKGPRHTGKTSLIMAIADHAARSGARTVRINLQMADAGMLSDPGRLLRWLCAAMGRRLGLSRASLEAPWPEVLGAKDNCTAFFEEHFLSEDRPLVLAIDNLDWVFESPGTAEDLLALLRAWHEMGKSQPPWDALRLVLAYSTEMYLPLTINHSPFNVGLPVQLGEWDAEVVADLARRHGLSWGAREVERLMALVGGHPHLVRVALFHAAGGVSLDELVESGATDEGLFADHLKPLLLRVESRPELREAALRVMESGEAVRVGSEVAFKLVSLGLAEQRGNEVRAARELYRRYWAGRVAA